MEVRVGGTNVGQRWRVTGFQAGDRSSLPSAIAMVALEFWLEGGHSLTYHQDLGVLALSPLSFDPALARSLGEHLIEMADHAEGA